MLGASKRKASRKNLTVSKKKGNKPEIDPVRAEREKRYNTREWRQLKDMENMTTGSDDSVVESSDNDSDYLMKGLNFRTEGDISHLTPAK